MRQKTRIISRDSTFVLLCAQPRCKTEQRNRESDSGATTLHDGNFDLLDGGPEYRNAPCWRTFHLSKESGGLKNPHTSAQSPGCGANWHRWICVKASSTMLRLPSPLRRLQPAPLKSQRPRPHAYRTTRIVSCSFFPMPRFLSRIVVYVMCHDITVKNDLPPRGCRRKDALDMTSCNTL